MDLDAHPDAPRALLPRATAGSQPHPPTLTLHEPRCSEDASAYVVRGYRFELGHSEGSRTIDLAAEGAKQNSLRLSCRDRRGLVEAIGSVGRARDGLTSQRERRLADAVHAARTHDEHRVLSSEPD